MKGIIALIAAMALAIAAIVWLADQAQRECQAQGGELRSLAGNSMKDGSVTYTYVCITPDGRVL